MNKPESKRTFLKAPGLLATFFLLVLFLFAWQVTGIVYSGNDDSSISDLYNGIFGTITDQISYIHPLLGAPLAALQRLFPTRDWYGILSILLLCWAWWMIAKLLLEKLGIAWGSLSVAAVFGSFGLFSLSQLQFTQNSGVLLLAGCLFLYRRLEQHLPFWKLLPGLLLIWAGGLLRWRSFFIPLGFFGGLCFYSYFIVPHKQGLLKMILLRKQTILAWGLSFILVFGFHFLSKCNFWYTDTTLTWQQFNSARSQSLDYDQQMFEQNGNWGAYHSYFEEKGYSVFDLQMNFLWKHADQNYFTIDRLEEIGQILTDATAQIPQSWRNITKNSSLYIWKDLSQVWIFFLPFTLAASALIWLPLKKKGNALWLAGVTVGFTLLFLLMYRFPPRIAFCVYASAFVVMLYQFGTPFLSSRKRCWQIAAAALVLIPTVLLSVHTYKYLWKENSALEQDAAYYEVFGITSQHKDILFVPNAGAFPRHFPLNPITPELCSNILPASWGGGTTTFYEVCNRYQVTNVYAECIDNENIIFLDAAPPEEQTITDENGVNITQLQPPYEINAIWQYLKEHFDPSVQWIYLGNSESGTVSFYRFISN
ncbi:MAG: hypothetical protein MSH10_00725 [Pygmaiobacter massiliensis]|nr:hypothetical protein [Pygmaiobacter massiliensis]